MQFRVVCETDNEDYDLSCFQHRSTWMCLVHLTRLTRELSKTLCDSVRAGGYTGELIYRRHRVVTLILACRILSRCTSWLERKLIRSVQFRVLEIWISSFLSGGLLREAISAKGAAGSIAKINFEYWITLNFLYLVFGIIVIIDYYYYYQFLVIILFFLFVSNCWLNYLLNVRRNGKGNLRGKVLIQSRVIPIFASYSADFSPGIVSQSRREFNLSYDKMSIDVWNQNSTELADVRRRFEEGLVIKQPQD